jgi:hypothetical protein
LLKESTGELEISIYRGDLTPKCIAQEVKKIQAAFPSLEPLWFNLLSERIIANNFSDQRLKDAIGYLLDNFRYPSPSIADIISFDKRVKLLTYGQLLIENDKTGRAFKDYECIDRNGKKYWINKAEKEMHNL